MLEGIVRPFQSPVVSAGRRIPISSASPTTEPAVLEWGAAGNMPTPENTSLGLQVCKEEATEKAGSRVTHDVRVENPNDPDEFVIVKRIDKLEFSKKHSKWADQFVAGGDAAAFAPVPEDAKPAVASDFAPVDIKSTGPTENCNLTLTFNNPGT